MIRSQMIFGIVTSINLLNFITQRSRESSRPLPQNGFAVEQRVLIVSGKRLVINKFQLQALVAENLDLLMALMHCSCKMLKINSRIHLLV